VYSKYHFELSIFVVYNIYILWAIKTTVLPKQSIYTFFYYGDESAVLAIYDGHTLLLTLLTSSLKSRIHYEYFGRLFKNKQSFAIQIIGANGIAQKSEQPVFVLISHFSTLNYLLAFCAFT